MDLISTRIIDVATLGLDGLSARHKAIASNIANADTPDYKRVDVTFEDQLDKIINTENFKESQKLRNSMDNNANMPLSVNYNNQSFMEMSNFHPQAVESDENPPNTNGNTVNIEQEMSELTKNGMKYNALATLQAKEFRILSDVIKGST